MSKHSFGYRRLHDPDPGKLRGSLPWAAPGLQVTALVRGLLLVLALGVVGLGMLLQLEGSFGRSVGGYMPAASVRPAYQILNYKNGGEPSVGNLQRVIDGQAPQCFYKGQDLVTTPAVSWPAEVGNTLNLYDGGGTDPAVAGTPLMGSDAAVTFDGSNYFRSSTAADLNIGTGDIYIEWCGVITGGGYLIRQYGSSGWTLYVHSNGTPELILKDGTNTDVIYGKQIAVFGCRVHVAFLVDKSAGKGYGYTDGVRAPTEATITVGDCSLTALGQVGYTQPTTMDYWGLWHATDFLSSHDSTIPAERFRALTGWRPQIAANGRDKAPSSWVRNCNADLEKCSEDGSTVENFPVGQYWMRIERWWDAAKNRTVTGYRAELEAENLCPYSTTTEGNWTKVQANDTTAAGDGPWGAGTAEGWVASTDSSLHSRNFTATVTTAEHIFWIRVKAGTVGWVCLYSSSGSYGRYFNLATGATGSTYSGGPAPTASLVGDIDANGYRRIGIVGTPNAGARTFTVMPAEADNDVSFAGNGSSAAITVAHTQVELGAVWSSAIKTEGAAVVRAKDQLELNITGCHVVDNGAIAFDLFEESAVGKIPQQYSPVYSFGTTSQRVYMLRTTAEAQVFYANLSGSSSMGNQAPTGTTERFAVSWTPNRLQAWRNGTSYTAGTGIAGTAIEHKYLALGQLINDVQQPSLPVLIGNVSVYNRDVTKDMRRISAGVY